MGERLELVTDFAKLTPGVLFILRNCGFCGGEHRLMAMGPSEWGGICYGLLAEINVAPVPPCGVNAICACAVPKNKLWRIADGLEASDSQTRSRQLETTR